LLLQQERDDAIHREIERLEKLERIAEKLHLEAKLFDIQLNDVETRNDEEAKRIDRHLVGDAAKNCDILSGELWYPVLLRPTNTLKFLRECSEWVQYQLAISI